MLPANFTSLSLLLARISSALYDSSSDGQGSQLERACERFGTCEEQSMQVHVNVRLCACTQLHRKRGLCARACAYIHLVCVYARASAYIHIAIVVPARKKRCVCVSLRVRSHMHLYIYAERSMCHHKRLL